MLRFDEELGLDCNSCIVKSKLRGIIYGGWDHFTCKFIGRSGVVWFHNGITTGRCCTRETELSLADLMSLHKSGSKIAVAMVYAKIS
ncbi:hypothetical protein B0H17DRAFT_959206 [Mycena rosella]|uniref:Uncharacterized protein n=1 Tax=Mycena rosella TaxID=1033263 RepID=A0AAD7FZJ4_MYCRO|nr:hypothetical protein B0H17DRAFT_959206 [Mycena rosella]